MTTTIQDTTAPTRTRQRTLVVVLFVVYLVLLAGIVLWKLEAPWVGEAWERQVKLVPFVSTDANGASDPVEVVANMLLFVPFGLYLGLLAPSWRWWRAAGVIAAASLGLEVAQYVLAVGSSDVTDVVANTAGGLVGLGVLALARLVFRARTTAVMTRVAAVATVLGLVVAALFVAAPLHFAGPPDGGQLGPPSGELPRVKG